MKHFYIEELSEASDDNCGFCISCGYMQDSCEPDARRYTCEECGKQTVYGAEELMLMGYGQ